MGKMSLSTSNVAQWVGGIRGKKETPRIGLGRGLSRERASREELEELGLAVIVPTIYEAR